MLFVIKDKPLWEEVVADDGQPVTNDLGDGWVEAQQWDTHIEDNGFQNICKDSGTVEFSHIAEGMIGGMFEDQQFVNPEGSLDTEDPSQ